MHLQKNILLLYNSFQFNSDISEYIFNYIRNYYTNIIIQSWYNKIHYKMNLFSHILSFPSTLFQDNNFIFYYYNPFDPAIALTFYKSSFVLNFNDDLDLWFKYFNRLNNFFKYEYLINHHDYYEYSISFAYIALRNFKDQFNFNNRFNFN